MEEFETLHVWLREEWYRRRAYMEQDIVDEKFKEFKSVYEDFTGPTVKEFVNLPESLYNQWSSWLYHNGYSSSKVEFVKKINSKTGKPCHCWFIDAPNDYCDHKFVEQTFKEVLHDFKKEWQVGTPEGDKMIKEMGLLSEIMNSEWNRKYNFRDPHVYEGYKSNPKIYEKKSKTQLWKEFKERWEIDPDNYNENILNEMISFINECESSCYEHFREYLSDGNYHSFDEYSILQQYEVCEEYYDDNR